MNLAGRIGGRGARFLWLGAAALLWSCSDLLHDSAPDTPRPLAIRLTTLPSSGAPAQALSSADAVRIIVERTADPEPPQVIADTVLPLSEDGEGARLRLALSPSLAGSELGVRVELRSGSAALFRGNASTTLRESGTTVVDLPIEPVVDRVRISTAAPALTAIGEEVDLEGEALFATGEVVPGVALVWRTLDPEVVTVSSGGRVTAVGGGEARVEGAHAGLADTVLVTVAQAVASLEVAPASASLLPGGSVTLAATARDANGHVAAGRAPTWTSSATAVATVDAASGVVRGIASGSATITATLGEVSGSAAITVNNPGPVVTSISPATAVAGSAAFELAVSGTGFVAGSTIRWNGQPRQTRRAGAELRATISSADITSPGTAVVTVSNPAPGGGTSAGHEFRIVAPAGMAVEPASLRFEVDRGGSAPAARTISVTSTGGVPLGTLRPEITYLVGSGWLSVSPATATAPANFSASVDAGSLLPGEYGARVVIRAEGAPGVAAEVPVTLVVRPTAPSAPTALSAVRAELSVDLSWSDNSDDETGFRVERREDDGPWSELATTAANVESYTDASVVRDQIYGYRVFAFNGAGSSGSSNEVEIVLSDAPTVTTTPPEGVSAGAATLTGTTVGNGSDLDVWFAWREVGGAVRETDRLPSSPRCTTEQECPWTWALGNLYGGRGYEYWLMAEGEAGSHAGDTIRFDTPPPEPPVVEGVSAQLLPFNRVRVQYSVTPAGADFWNWLEISEQEDMLVLVYRSTDAPQTIGTRAGSTEPWIFTSTLSGLRANTTYYWRAGARDAAGVVTYAEIRSFDSNPGGGDDDDDDD